MNPAGRELQMRDMDSKFRHELEKIRNNESGDRTKFQVEIERNLERHGRGHGEGHTPLEQI